jgi:hypothetical protein
MGDACMYLQTMVKNAGVPCSLQALMTMVTVIYVCDECSHVTTWHTTTKTNASELDAILSSYSSQSSAVGSSKRNLRLKVTAKEARKEAVAGF